MNFNTNSELHNDTNKNNDSFIRSLRIAAIILSLIDIFFTALSFKQALDDYRKED